jgi:hypothetical protein
MRRQFVFALFCAGLITSSVLIPTASAQESSKPRPTQKEIRRRLGQVTTQAVANFRAADSIEQRLHADGASLHPQLIALRFRI